MKMKSWQERIRAWAISKEWRGVDATPRSLPEDVALIHSEVSETLEAYREVGSALLNWYTFTIVVDGVKIKNLTVNQVRALGGVDYGAEILESPEGQVIFPAMKYEEKIILGKPEGVGPELADALIRILDTAEEHGLDMDYEVTRKMLHNDSREIRHGGKFL